MKHNLPCEAIVLATEKDKDALVRNIPYLYKNIGVKKVIVIANVRDKTWIQDIEGAFFFDESKVYPGLNIDTIRDKILTLTGTEKYAGWYLQQFLKMAWCYQTVNENYVTVDADTSILNKVDYITNDGRYYLTIKVEFHKQYFDTLDSLFDSEITRNKAGSFIAEQMIFDCAYMREIIESIESRHDSKSFFDVILESINRSDISKGGFSEFETYGNYVTQKHPSDFVLRKLRTFRQGSDILSTHPTKKQIEWATKDFDILSLENYDFIGKRVRIFRALASLKLVQRLISFRNIAKLYQDITRLSNFVGKKNTIIFDDID